MLNWTHALAASCWAKISAFLLAAHSLLVIAAVTVGLRFRDFDQVFTMAVFLAGVAPRTSRRHADDARRIARGVLRAKRVVRRAGCMAMALTAHALMRRRGIQSELIVGFRPDASGPNGESHAWVTCGGAVVIGDSPDLDTFIPIVVLDGGQKDHSKWGGIF